MNEILWVIGVLVILGLCMYFNARDIFKKGKS